MTALMDYIRVTTTRLNVEVDGLDSLRYVMNVLKEVLRYCSRIVDAITAAARLNSTLLFPSYRRKTLYYIYSETGNQASCRTANSSNVVREYRCSGVIGKEHTFTCLQIDAGRNLVG